MDVDAIRGHAPLCRHADLANNLWNCIAKPAYTCGRESLVVFAVADSRYCLPAIVGNLRLPNAHAAPVDALDWRFTRYFAWNISRLRVWPARILRSGSA